MDALLDYMKQRKWTEDKKEDRKRYLFHLAQESQYSPDISGKIGGMLIYNQIIEQFLTDIVTKSIYYIKAEVWPVVVELDIDIENATFGRVIEAFRQFATIEPNRNQILTYLKKYNTKRNQVVHDLFDIHDLERLSRELDDYALLADEIVQLLIVYEKQVRENFENLCQRADFRQLLAGFEDPT